jgi:hypothetical protein
MMQREELDIARGDARESEKARLKAEVLSARQADALLAAARINAASAILGSTRGEDLEVRLLRKEQTFGFKQSDTMR